jgi:hypothetical protein
MIILLRRPIECCKVQLQAGISFAVWYLGKLCAHKYLLPSPDQKPNLHVLMKKT